MSLNAITGIANSALDAFNRPNLDSVSAGEARNTQNSKVQSSTSKVDKEPNFLERLVSASRTKQKPSLNEMTDRLASLKAKGTLVLHHPLDSTVKSYVKDLKDFLGDIRDHAYDSMNKNDHFQRIDVADTKLDALAEDLLQTEKAELALLESLGELQGLIIDIYV